MSDIVIEPMGAEHVADVYGVECELFETPWTEAMFQQEVDHDHSFSRPFVALADGHELAGYMINWFLADEVHLLNIGIAPSFQRKGYARRLMEYLIVLAEKDGREHIILEVREGNTAARSLYDSMEFMQIGIRKRYYEDSLEDAIVMILHLQSRIGDNV